MSDIKKTIAGDKILVDLTSMNLEIVLYLPDHETEITILAKQAALSPQSISYISEKGEINSFNHCPSTLMWTDVRTHREYSHIEVHAATPQGMLSL